VGTLASLSVPRPRYGLVVSHRPLALAFGLTLADYLLWNWSLSGNHGALALVSGLTLLPLALASLWWGALGLARLIANSTRRSRALDVQRQSRVPSDRTGQMLRSAAPAERPGPAAAPVSSTTLADQTSALAGASSAASSGELAA
jgi:hypothetical protein